MRVLIASHYTSENLGGEAAIPLRLYDRLRSRGVDTWLVTYRTDEDELRARFAHEPERLILMDSLPGMDRFFRFGETLPDGPRTVAWAITQVERQLAMVKSVRDLVKRLSIDVVHQPIGIAPGVPSALTKLGAPLIIGPLNGGMTMPPAFSGREPALARATQLVRRPIGAISHQVFRGKLQAAKLLAANDRSRSLLPRASQARADLMPESAITAHDWPAKTYSRQQTRPTSDRAARFVFVGRLVPYKAPDILLECFARVIQDIDAHLEIVGDGPMRAELEATVAERELTGAVHFSGWQSKEETSQILRKSDVFVFPSLREPGGTVILEAMASGLPCVVADWGGPSEYVTEDTGIRISVQRRDSFIPEMARAMTNLANDPESRASMGQKARERVLCRYTWDILTDEVLSAYRDAIASTRSIEIDPSQR